MTPARTRLFALSWTALSALGSLTACSATPEPHGLVDIGPGKVGPQPTATAATSTQMAPPPPPGRAGWFFLRDPMEATAAMVRPDLCVAVHEGRQWLISPDTSVTTSLLDTATVCDGTAKRGTAGWPDRPGFAVLPLKERLFYHNFYGYFVGAALDAAPEFLDFPVTYKETLVPVGDSVLLLGSNELRKRRSLLRLEGAQWAPINLDGGEVTSVVGAPDGRAFAVTSKNRVYQSADAGSTWTPIPVAEKGLELGQLSLDQDYERSRTGSVRLAVKRAGDEQRLEMRLAWDVPLPTFGARFVTSQPEGVTTFDGVSADVEAQARARLTDGRLCSLVAVTGSSAVAACAGVAVGELALWHTDDGGVSVREIARFRSSHRLAGLAMTDSKILMVFGCRATKPDECRSEHVRLLERGEIDVWKERRVEIPGQSGVYQPVLDRAGGFYLRGESLDSNVAQPETTLVHLSDQRVDVVSLSSRLRRTTPDRPLTVGPMTVHDDGTLGFIIAEGSPARTDGEISYQHLTRDGAMLEKRVLETGTFAAVRFDSIALVGRKIVALLANQDALLVSDDAGATFSVHKPLAFQQFAIYPTSYYSEGTRFVCGSAGCDLINERKSTRLAWRWGSEPLRATLTDARSRAQDK